MDPPGEFDIHGLTSKASIAESDEFPIYGPNVGETRKLLWSTIKSVLKSYFNQLYAAITHKHKISDISDFPEINYYQAEEIVVGSWFSEPLYRSVIQITDLETEAGSFSRPHNITDVSIITRVEGILVSDGSTQYLSNVSADKTDIFYTLDTVTESSIGYLVIEYTKQSGEEVSENDGV